MLSSEQTVVLRAGSPASIQQVLTQPEQRRTPPPPLPTTTVSVSHHQIPNRPPPSYHEIAGKIIFFVHFIQ